MGEKLYRITITYFAVADSAMEAAQMVAIDRSAVTVDEETEITSVDEIDPEWLGAVPFGADDDRTCKQYFPEDDEPATSEAFLPPLFQGL